ncbi:MAG: hypothetical protein Q8T13_13725 [Acidobacteriota bacterium]|nr:hypothetical protein [Acidobacteriota bacterium]
MPKPLSPEQIAAIRSVPLGTMPNKVGIVLAMTSTRQADIVEARGLSASQVSNANTGKGVTTVDTAREIAAFFVCDIELLFPGAEESAAEADERLERERREAERRSGEDRRAKDVA